MLTLLNLFIQSKLFSYSSKEWSQIPFSMLYDLFTAFTSIRCIDCASVLGFFGLVIVIAKRARKSVVKRYKNPSLT